MPVAWNHLTTAPAGHRALGPLDTSPQEEIKKVEKSSRWEAENSGS